MAFTVNPIKFGTDGWRGVIAADFTFERVAKLAPLSAHVLREYNPNSNLMIVGFDRRFLAEDFAKLAADSLQEAGFDVLLSDSFAPTPAFSWAAKEKNALGALVLTASHNPAKYLGLKVKGAFGGSVTEDVTQKIEALIPRDETITSSKEGNITLFDPWESYCQQLSSQVNVNIIRDAIASGKLKIFVDVMHGAASGGLRRLLGCDIEEINANRDPLFDGGAPEPLPRYISELFRRVKEDAKDNPHRLRMGLVFDGDCDRIAAIDGQGNFCSTQILIPVLIEHLAQRKGMKGEIVKTVSGSDLIPKIAQFMNIPISETAIGYKYIAERMLQNQVLVGGEESGGVGYSNHIPERDALLSALYVLEAVVESGKDISDLYNNLRQQVNFTSEYDRIDLPLKNLEQKNLLQQRLSDNPLTEIAGKKVIDCLAIDGYKYRLEDSSWLLIRFSGTEPLLRLYSEAPTLKIVQENLHWAKEWATKG
ncbi:phosphoglucomutase/phosphomannomutase family protein [Cyanobacterium aponinum UTEX 3222]|uniref:Phosphoglucosamine mutase n=1 Tax=Cyanobacterium aponinum (strain PCC 10605) TaxID=755178 RepID=K9Z973_CYAAP|nr:phosphoglucomutase/phosphomannomutase family protein [Cyanobacterium aponinum]AFZ55155.1 Phosphoglucosamine mutase [Cyanobacterium aponinum PCC 10605]PHV63434.1 phosphoglucosamine mutase [Cyanobacterium aponinum IPPAS B-1201]WRL42857.1 phosphoglucomutase/phosphomannomutase family protein [Cyanobacterium aponinum UTEX 3222]